MNCSIQERFRTRSRDQKIDSGPKEKEVKILKISLLANARESLHSLTLNLQVEQITDAFRKELVKVLSDNPGKVTIHLKLHDKNENMCVKLFSRSHRVDLTPEFLDWLYKKGIDYSVE